MRVRRACPEDRDEIFRIYAAARAFMRANGNPTQWGDSQPEPGRVLEDIARRQLYIVEDGGRPRGVFALVPGPDPTYRLLEGAWPDDGPYSVIHRAAGDGTVRGVMRACLDYCGRQAARLRADTHRNNAVMRHILEKEGFLPCGVIYVEDGSPRDAYQKTIPASGGRPEEGAY